MKLDAGKLPPHLLRAVLASIHVDDPAVLVHGAPGEDAAVIDTGGDELLVAKTDPITFAGDDAGRYLVAVNGNDLATMGAEPRWLLATVLLPEGVEDSRALEVLEGLRRACQESGVALVGGHTEITVGLDRLMLVGCLLGTVPRNRLVRTSGAKVGDTVLLTGGIAIEGTAILAREHADALRERGVADAVVQRAAEWLRSPGISVLRAARAVHATGAAHSMHDPTEGGLATALQELAEAAGVGLRIDWSAVTILPECAASCAVLGLDPLGLLASGALLATLDAREAAGALARLQAAGIPAAVIGEVVPPGDAGTSRLPAFPRDELARYLATK
jgi:hydrogenase expression/formation protein HypE